MIGIHESDQPLLDAAACAARGDRNAVRLAVKQSEALAEHSGMRLVSERIQWLADRFLRPLKVRL